MKLASLLCIVLVVLTSAAIETPFEKIINGFNRYTLEQPQEKIYVHLDRSNYFVGETIWLKSYLVEGANHEASQLSNTIYVELINESKQVVKQIKQFAHDGWAAGSIVLPDTLRSGDYVIRAYTNWMRNFSDAYFFYREINISDFGSASNNLVSADDPVSIQFFPEGGDLVDGIGSRVGIKAIGKDGLARKVQGKVVDAQGNFITAFKSNALGMGAFVLTPESGKKYEAIVEGVAEPVVLPSPKSAGITLSVINLPGQDKVSVRIQTASYPEEEIFLLVQSRGVVSYSPVLKLTKGGLITKLEKDQLLEGINQITALNSSGQPVCERLIYIEKPENELKVTLTTDKPVYSAREKVTMTVETKDAQGKPVAANLSLAVGDNKQNPFDPHRESLYTYLTLSSDLKGHIESPGYYFDEKKTDRHMALDWLLMTQGWRRFTVEQALQYDGHKLSYVSEQGITVRGTMLDKFTNKPIVEGKVTYLDMSSILSHQETITDVSGRFELRNIVFYDSSKLVLQGETKKGKRWTSFVMDSTIKSPEVNFTFSVNQKVLELHQKELISSAIDRKGFDMEYNFDENAVVLNEVKVRAKRELDQSNRMYGQAQQTIVVAGNENLENKSHPLLALQGYPGILIFRNSRDWDIRFTDRRRRQRTIFLVDNVQVHQEMIQAIPLKNIQSIDIYSGPETVAFAAEGVNVVAIYTNEKKHRPEAGGIFSFNNGGYNVGREFYSPEYDVNHTIDMFDTRATLFWEPNIQTDSITGRATVSFYNHDVETSVTGVLEGITLAGKAGSATYQYAIKKK